jgi:hypothetical protein
VPPPINIFADANVILAFYGLSKETLEEIRKLTAAIKVGKIRLYANSHLRDEVARNREVKLKGAFAAEVTGRVPRSYPEVFRAYPAFDEINQLTQELEKKRQALFDGAVADATAFKLSADEIIKTLFEAAKTATVSDKIYAKAETRLRRGNPPGKKDSIGDAVHWEFLLENVPDGEELFLITQDGDFASLIDEAQVSSFLQEEWVRLKKSKVSLFRSLSAFFKERFPEITLAVEIERKSLIDALVYSGSFSDTHKAIAALAKIDNLTVNEVRQLANALLDNEQIGWIGGDGDVRAFYSGLAEKHDAALGAGLVAKVKKRIGIAVAVDDTPL